VCIFANHARAATGGLTQQAGQFRQHAVANGVAVAVVDTFEVVDVDHRRSQRLHVGFGVGHQQAHGGHLVLCLGCRPDVSKLKPDEGL
jgi:hypothetical protein